MKKGQSNYRTDSVTLTTSEFPQYQYSAAIENLQGLYGSIFSHYHFSFNGLILKKEEREKKKSLKFFLKLEG